MRAAWVYDSSGVLISDTTQGNRATSYAYSASLLRLTSMTEAIGTRNIRYDATTGIPDSVSDPTDSWVRYSFDSKGRLHGPSLTASSGYSFSRIQLYRANGGLFDMSNEQHYSVAELWQTSSEVADTLVEYWTERHGSGATAIIMQDSVTYDGWERVTGLVHLTDGQVTASDTFAFGRRGNLTVNGNGATFNTKDQLTSTSACSSHSYDLAGNLTGKTCNGKDWVYTYDALDRLTNVTFDGAFVAAYTYDVLGNRIAKRTATATTRFVWRGGHVIYEVTAGDTVSYQWGMGTDDLVALHDHGTGAHYYVVQDKLHSVRGLVNRDGTWVGSWRYRAYGVVLDSAGSASAGLKRFRWAGAQYDAETGLYFLRTRYYDPVVGRFVQEDKIGRAGGLNLYAYASGRPLAARDPSGTRDDYYLLGELLWAPASHNCWGIVCNPDGIDGRRGGGGDWDGNGRDDALESFDLFWAAGMNEVGAYEYKQWLEATRPNRERVQLDLIEQYAIAMMCNQNGLDCSNVQIVIGPASNIGSAVAFLFKDAITLGNTIYVESFSVLSDPLLVHELTHVWQYQTWGWAEYYVRGLTERSYTPTIDGRRFFEYGMEQQASIVTECYRGSRTSAFCELSPFKF